MNTIRARWAAVGAAVAVSIGAGGIGVARAVVEDGPKPIFVPITPCRIMDTRTASDFNTGPRATPLGANETYDVQAAGGTNGDCTDIPAEAVGLVMNVTITDPTANTFVTIFPTGEARPVASNLNALAGKVEPAPNLVTTDLSADGKFSVYNLAGTTNVFADVAGYYEDHNHDDRYLTDAEVAALIDAEIADERASFAGDLDARDDRLRDEFAAGDDLVRDEFAEQDALIRLELDAGDDLVRDEFAEQDALIRADIDQINSDLELINTRLDQINTRLDQIDIDLVTINGDLVRIDGLIGDINADLININARLDAIEAIVIIP